jgi:hypothetical protein
MQSPFLKIAGLGAAFVFAASAHAAGANLVKNGSFEANAITDSAGWQQVAAVTGWTSSVTGNDAFELQKGASQGGQGGFDPLANTGSQYLELNTDQFTSVSQNIATATSGVYTVSFAYNGRPGTPGNAASTMEVFWGGKLVDTVTGNTSGTWQTASLNLAATAGATELTFKSIGPTSAPSYGSYLDSVSVTAPVPEPGTYAMLLAGLGLIGYTARRNRKKAA